MMDKHTCIFVASFDGYSDLWDVFFECFHLNWKDNKNPVYLVTNIKTPSYSGVVTIATGEETSWSNRIKKAIDSVKEEYIILFLEDYLIHKPVDNQIVEKAIEFVRDNDIDFLRLEPIPKIKNKTTNFAVPLSKKLLYGINLQCAIWKKDFLLKCLCGDFSAWEFEARQKNGEATQVPGKLFGTDFFVIPYLNGILQGKWWPDSVKELRDIGINVNTNQRGELD